MAKTTIEYTDEVSNPLYARPIGEENVKIGTFCEKPDAEGTCKNCWAESLNLRFGNKFEFDKSNRSKIEWIYNDKPMQRLRSLNADKRESERHPGHPLMVFCCDTFDLFQPSISDELRHQLFDQWDNFTNLSLQIQTTYPAKMSRFIKERYKNDIPKHYWFGISAGTQDFLNKNLGYLFSVKSAVRYVIFEPLLEQIVLNQAVNKYYESLPLSQTVDFQKLEWVIIGGESGSSPRPFYLEYGLDLINQCRSVKIPVLFKQAGAFAVSENVNLFDFSEETKLIAWGNAASSTRIKFKDKKGKNLSELPIEFRIREFPK